MCVCVCVSVIVEIFLCLTQVLDLLLTSHFCIGLACKEIKTEIWASFSSFIWSGSVQPQ